MRETASAARAAVWGEAKPLAVSILASSGNRDRCCDHLERREVQQRLTDTTRRKSLTPTQSIENYDVWLTLERGWRGISLIDL